MNDSHFSIAPIPFDDRARRLALEMKRQGLPWSPQVGYFVWDHKGVIARPAPFPNRTYFILNLKRFLNIFGDMETMREQLVWLPTAYQASQLCRQLGIDEVPRADGSTDAAEALVQRYRGILACLKEPAVGRSADRPVAQKGGLRAWVDRVMEAEVGDLRPLPDDVRRHIQRTYLDVATAYLGWRRIQEQRPDDWLPPESRFDPALLGELGHFYSDYQQPVRALERIRRNIDLLRTIDPRQSMDAYRLVRDRLMNQEPQTRSAQRVLEALTAPHTSPPVS